MPGNAAYCLAVVNMLSRNGVLFHLKTSTFQMFYHNSDMGLASDDVPCGERQSYKIAMLPDLLEYDFRCPKLTHVEVQPVDVATRYAGALFLQFFVK
jgi:hypothetical protein